MWSESPYISVLHETCRHTRDTGPGARPDPRVGYRPGTDVVESTIPLNRRRAPRRPDFAPTAVTYTTTCRPAAAAQRR